MKKKSVITTVESKSDTVKLQMAKILFNSDSYSLGDISQERLAKLASYLKKTNQNWERVKISGHTDETGNDKYNLSLSQDRADAILKVLIVNGVSETKISSIGYGSRRPVDKDTLAQNRRIEIEFFGVKNRQELNSSIQKILKGS